MSWKGEATPHFANKTGADSVTLTIDRMVEEYVVRTAPDAMKIEKYRSELMAQSRAEQITDYLGWFGSHERAMPLWEETEDEPADVFWSVFLETWPSCDGLWPLRQILLPTLQRRKAELSPIEFMEPADRVFCDGLPERVTVYSGCGRRDVHGMS
jgi:hypothetical protein